MAKLSSSSFALDFLRRLLCAHSTSGNADTNDAAPELEPEGRSPCIVARLMGLDAMPPPPEPAHAQQPLRRSSVEPGPGGPCGISNAAHQAAVRPSASLREKPAYLRAENDMFLLLSFSPEADREACKKADFDECRREDTPHGEQRVGRKQRRPHRRKLQFGGRGDECNSTPQASSPVSVLEAHEDSSTTTTTTTTSCSLEDVDTHSDEAPLLFASEQQSSSSSASTTPHRASFALPPDEDVSPATPSTVVHATGCCRAGNRRRAAVAGKSDASTPAPDVSGVWQPVCRLVEEDLRSTGWLRRHGACATNAAVVVVAEEVGSEILEQLVCEELVRLCSD